MLKSILTVALFALSLGAQAPLSVTPFLDGVLTLHDNGVASYTDGTNVAYVRSTGGNGGWVTVPAIRGGVQGPIVDMTPTLPTFTTRYIDKKGVQHEVNTPVPSTTVAGIAKALDLHRRLVEAMQVEFPPLNP